MNMDTEILSWGGGRGVIESFRLPFVSEASEGRSDELGRNYLSWDTWKKIVVKKYLFFAKLQPVEVGGEAKIHWFWCIFTKGIIRENPLPQLRPPRFSSWRVGFFLNFFLVKGFDIYFKFYASGGLSELPETNGRRERSLPPPQDSISVSMFKCKTDMWFPGPANVQFCYRLQYNNY